MIYKRQYVQYNDLVFDDAEMISADDFSVSFKDNATEYSYGHGSYAPMKSQTGLVQASSVSLTITLKMGKLPCDQIEFYPDFARDQLFKAGKLWAVHNNHIEWAFAYITSFSEHQDTRHDTVEIDVDFALPEGYWHKADVLRTFLIPYNKCDAMDCSDYHRINYSERGCCSCVRPVHDQCGCCCEEVTQDMALVYHIEDLDKFSGCDVPYKLKYDCLAADKFFCGIDSRFTLGQKFCSVCGSVIAGTYYSDTNLPTDNITITIHGKVKDPRIEINDNVNVIKGEYEGTLTINPDGSVYLSDGDRCPDCNPECTVTLLDPSVWEIPEGNSYGWEIHHGNNSVIIEPNACCGTVCAYIDADSITL